MANREASRQFSSPEEVEAVRDAIKAEGVLPAAMAALLYRALASPDKATQVAAARAIAEAARLDPDEARGRFFFKHLEFAAEIDRLARDPALADDPHALLEQARKNGFANDHAESLLPFIVFAPSGRGRPPNVPRSPRALSIEELNRLQDKFKSSLGADSRNYEFFRRSERLSRPDTEIVVKQGTVLPKDVMGSGIPKGFASSAEFRTQMQGLKDAIAASKSGDFVLGVRGSALHGRGFDKSTGLHTGAPFDVGRKSDIDLFVVSKPLYDRAKARNLTVDSERSTPLGPIELEKLGLTDLARRLSAYRGESGRDNIRIMIYERRDAVSRRGSYLTVR